MTPWRTTYFGMERDVQANGQILRRNAPPHHLAGFFPKYTVLSLSPTDEGRRLPECGVGSGRANQRTGRIR
jgi:hypothetical protein